MADVTKIWLTCSGDVINEQEGTMQQHYRFVFKRDGLVYMAGFCANNLQHAERTVRRNIKGLPVLNFVPALREALR